MRVSIVIVLAALVSVPSFAGPSPGPGTVAVKSANDTISKLLQQKAAPGSPQEKQLAAQVTTSVRNFLDIDELGKRALVDHWGKLKPDEQKAFLDNLRGLIEDNYVKGLRSNLTYKVNYTGESTDKSGNIVVTTEVVIPKKNRSLTIKIDYVLKKDASGLKAWDVNTDGAGLVDNYRTQFDKIIEKDGFPKLIEKMQKKRDELKADDKKADDKKDGDKKDGGKQDKG
jgi:phospholipid transport system substrate-binding protein